MTDPTKIGELDDVTLSASQSFRAMGKFLQAYFKLHVTNDRSQLAGPTRAVK